MIWFFTGPFLYLAAATFAAGAAAKLISLACLPRHLRWELYPLPRLGDAGSKYQQVDFAGQPPHTGWLREIAFMAVEIFTFRKVFAGRRDLWLGSLLLHAGLYLGIVFLGLLGAGAIGALLGQSPWLSVLARATGALGLCGLLCGLAGTLYLVCLRLADRGLRAMSDRVTFFNLIFLAALFGCWLLAWRADPAFVAARAHLASLFRGRPGPVESPFLASSLVLAGLFAAYLPFSRMFHVAAKYFFYHAILWDDAPLRRGSRMERDFAAYLDERLTWPAAHLRPNRSWSEQLGGDETAQGTKHDA